MGSLTERARQLRATIEGLTVNLTDNDALEAKELFPAWIAGKSYAVGDRVRYNDTLYKVLQAHTSQTDWTPTNAPSLFAEVLPGQDGTDIGEWVQPDSTNPYQIGDRVIHNGIVYECVVANNVWEPGVYGWEIVTE